MPHYSKLIIYFDGASRSNPNGPAGCGWAMYEMDNSGNDDERVAHGQFYLGYGFSNNQAEYEGLDTALEFMHGNAITCDYLYIRGDSDIVIKQLDGTYEVRSNNIKAYHNAVMDHLAYVHYGSIEYGHISRFRNYEADSLANDAIDCKCNYDVWY